MPGAKSERVAKYAEMFSAMGTEPRLRIMQLLLSAHPDGLVVGEIQDELEIPNSTLSHHMDKLRTEDLVLVKRKGLFCGIPRILGRCRNCCSFSMPSAAPETRPLSRRTLCRSADRRTLLMSVNAEESVPQGLKPASSVCRYGTAEAVPFPNPNENIREVVRQKYGEAALRVKSGGSSCCGVTAPSGCTGPVTRNLYD